jgi:hypothetical protein
MDNMFRNCTSLTEATLSAADYGFRGLENIFNGCSGLSLIDCGLTAWNGTTNWVTGVAATGNFYCPAALGTNDTIERGVNRCPEGWNVRNPAQATDGVEFKALENTVMSFGKTNASAPDVSLQKSTDGGQTWSAYSVGDTITVPQGSSVKFKAADGVVNGAFCHGAVEAEGEDLSCVRLFTDYGALSASGDMSLLIDSRATGATVQPYQFAGLFKGCDAVVDASGLKLPGTADHSFY